MRQDSDSELAGKLGASLTPAVARAHTPRGQQNSGMFDLHAFYTAQVEQQQMQAMQAPLVLPVPRIAPPLQVRVPARVPQRIDAYDAYQAAIARAIPRPIGWYAVFVTWLATVTLAVGATTQVPAHVSARMHPSVATATAVAPATATASAAAPATATAKATATATATAAPSSSVPEFTIADLPRVSDSSRVQQKAVAPVVHVRVAPPSEERSAEPPAATPTPKAAPAPKPAAPPPPAPEPVAAAPAPPPATTHAPPALATPLSTGGTLEDLIRREVAAEQKKVHAAKGQ
ncbi:MAG TPA: hypothetical protein VF765_08650 [Polyangiaceae bacterium]